METSDQSQSTQRRLGVALGTSIGTNVFRATKYGVLLALNLHFEESLRNSIQRENRGDYVPDRASGRAPRPAPLSIDRGDRLESDLEKDLSRLSVAS